MMVRRAAKPGRIGAVPVVLGKDEHGGRRARRQGTVSREPRDSADCRRQRRCRWSATPASSSRAACPAGADVRPGRDRKSTCLNSSHITISYAVFCLKKKKKHISE